MSRAPDILELDTQRLSELRRNAHPERNVRGFRCSSIVWTTSDDKNLEDTYQMKTERGVRSEVSVTSPLTSSLSAMPPTSSALTLWPFNITAIIHTTTPATTTTIPPPQGAGVLSLQYHYLHAVIAIWGVWLYFLYKKGKICGRSASKTSPKRSPAKITCGGDEKRQHREAVLLGSMEKSNFPTTSEEQ
ncbi:hypothetical protein FQN60_005109 [Etheostoma spectabile]|uniref:Uncharacterized protein n=1 Tax=Etheostoma spectabile TaxID=54343 RepID=A0A5J5DLM7_9PERO|nr:hypothetical protein FQN60_005109 [Etheostoma spectabile]